jgi:hypothetical protein
MNNAVMQFVKSIVEKDHVANRRILEVGALDFNGSARSIIETMQPAEYLGVDMQQGAGVDRVISVSFLTDQLGSRSFGLVVSTEMLEHVQDWRWAVSQLKRSVEPGGRLLITTRSPGFYYHGYPHDFWRFTEADFRLIFSDLDDLVVCTDDSEPGVFMYGRIPDEFIERELSSIHPATCPDPPLGLRQYLRRILKRRPNQKPMAPS